MVSLKKRAKTHKTLVLIAHVGGAYKRQQYLNSMDALDYNYSLGHRVFEIDFNWTKDKQLVGIHDWEDIYRRLFPNSTINIPTETEFSQLSIIYHQTQLTLKKLDSWLIKHPDAFIVTDIRGQNVKGLTLMKNTMQTAIKQIIPQMYHPTNYLRLRQLGYDNIIFTLYATKLGTQTLLDFINNNYLYAVTINPEKEDFIEIANSIIRPDAFIYVHTFNKVEDVDRFRNKGVDGLYTDFLYIDDKGTVINNYSR